MLKNADLPGIWRGADDASARGQKLTLLYTGAKVAGGVVAAVGALLTWNLGRVDLAAWIVFVGFLVALLCELASWATQPERLWYDGRAVAESAKTLAWRYAVGADPFPVSMSRDEAEELFRSRMSAIADQVSDQVVFDDSQTIITDSMDRLRSSTFEARRTAYIDGRTLEQRDWYARKARFNRRHATAWRIAMIFAEVIAVVFAAGRVFGDWSVDAAGLLAAIVGAATAWVAVKQFSPLASAYSVATKELGVQASRLKSVPELDWPLVIADAEEAISREHTTWLASRTGKLPSR